MKCAYRMRWTFTEQSPLAEGGCPVERTGSRVTILKVRYAEKKQGRVPEGFHGPGLEKAAKDQFRELPQSTTKFSIEFLGEVTEDEF